MPLYQKIAVVGAALFAGGLFLGMHLETAKYSAYLDDFKTVRRTDDPYKLVAPLVGIDSPSALKIGHYKNLERLLADYAAAHPDETDAYALYYRDLNSSQWFGINEEQKFIPASLLKIAIAFVVLKKEAADPSLARRSKVYTPAIAATNTSVAYLEPSALVVGRAYETQDLLERMIIDSDNGAKDLLYSLIDIHDFFDLFRLMGVTEPVDALAYTLSPKDYALFLRMLYGGTYLTSADSERLLEILTRVKFTQGLVAGVPPTVAVAHKYGTFTLTNAMGDKTGIELHDCGIVYHPQRPYILCVMTKGQDAQKMAHFIADASAIVYRTIDAHEQ